MSNKLTFPSIFRTVELLYEDQGDMNIPKQISLPIMFSGDTEKVDWHRVEKVLSALSEEGLCNFAIGDEEDQKLIKEWLEDGDYAHRAVDTLWQYFLAGE